MGRKELDIKYVEDEKRRKITFKTRLGGLIKKLYDLTVLCKVNTSLVITDLEGNLITYSNSNLIQLLVSDDFNSRKHDFSVSAWQESDVSVPFL